MSRHTLQSNVEPVKDARLLELSPTATTHTSPSSPPSPKSTTPALSWLAGRLCTIFCFLAKGAWCIYVYAILFALHRIYLWFIDDALDNRYLPRRPRRERRRMSLTIRIPTGTVRTPVMDVVGWTCYMTMALALSCLYLGMSAVQYATEVVPKTMGYVAMVVGGDSFINAILILVFIGLAKTNDSMSRGFMTRLSHSARDRAAKIFAVPLSCFVWCLVTMIACSITYYTQPSSLLRPAILFHLPSILTAEHTTHRTPANGGTHPLDPGVTHDKHTPSSDTTAPSSSSPSSPAFPVSDTAPLPPAALVILGHLAMLAFLRFVLVVQSIARLRWPRRVGTAGTPQVGGTIDEEAIELGPRDLEEDSGLEEVSLVAPGATAVDLATAAAAAATTVVVVPHPVVPRTMVSNLHAVTVSGDAPAAVLVVDEERDVARYVSGAMLTVEPEDIDAPAAIPDQDAQYALQHQEARLHRRSKRCVKRQSGSAGWVRAPKSASNSLNTKSGSSGCGAPDPEAKDGDGEGKDGERKGENGKRKEGCEDSSGLHSPGGYMSSTWSQDSQDTQDVGPDADGGANALLGCSNSCPTEDTTSVDVLNADTLALET